MTEKKLFLLDAMALIYRAHFAFSKTPRINSKGMNTGAVLGFVNTLWEIISQQKPTHIGVAFDTAAPTFRHVQFEAYKANRDAQPEEIQLAIPLIKDIVRAFRMPVLERDGYEADDVIGTLAKKAAQEGFEVFMMTPDKDYGQLVEERIFLYKPAFMGNAVEVMGVPEVLAKWDIARVAQVTDMLGLQGDAVDNIPGIPGIGPKTAAKLLAQYDTVENLVAHAHELKGKQRENVETFGQQGILSKQLATIDINVPIDFAADTFAYTGFDQAALQPIFEELEFRTLARRLFETEPSSKPETRTAKSTSPQQTSLFELQTASVVPNAPETFRTLDTTPHRYYVVSTPEERASLRHFLALQPTFCFDTETTSTDAHEAELVGIAFAYVAGEAFYVPVPAERAAARALVQEFSELFATAHIAKIGQNLKYDILVLENYGIEIKGPLRDTMIAHYLAFPDLRHGMDSMAETHLAYKPVPIESLIGKKGKGQGSMRDVPSAQVAEYAGEDADITLQLWQVLEREIEERGLQTLFYEIEMPLMQVLAAMEQQGVALDTPALSQYSQVLEQEIARAEEVVYAHAGEVFNIGSPKQLGEILFDKLQLIEKPKKTKTGQYATGEEVLVSLAAQHEIVRNILTYRQLQKLKSTYVDALPKLVSAKDGRVHTSYNQTVTVTGRLSSTNPNLQNIPIKTEQGREIRKAFIPRSADFVLLAADYSQVELRILAAFSQDPTMVQAFREGRDIHAATAAKIFRVPLEAVDSEMRRRAKTANFGIIYGVSAHGLSEQLHISRKEAGEIINAYFEEFSTIKQYMDGVVNFAREHGYVETIMKRRRYLPNINSRNFTQRGFDERNAVNTPIQGSAADIIKKAMVEIHAWMQTANLRARLLMQVHDELVFDVHREEVELLKEKVAQLMENAASLAVPLKVEIGTGQNWLEAH